MGKNVERREQNGNDLLENNRYHIVRYGSIDFQTETISYPGMSCKNTRRICYTSLRIETPLSQLRQHNFTILRLSGVCSVVLFSDSVVIAVVMP